MSYPPKPTSRCYICYTLCYIFNRQLAFRWVLIVLLISLISSFILMGGGLKRHEKKLVRSFNLIFRYIDDVLLLSNSRFCDYVDRIH